MKKNLSSRRSFIKGTSAASLLGVTFLTLIDCQPDMSDKAVLTKTPWEPKLSENLYNLNDSMLRWMAQIGHKHVVLQDDGRSVDLDNKGYWTVEDIRIAQKRCEEFGMELASLLIPLRWYNKNCKGEPGRDEEIDNIVRSIKAAGEAGISMLEWRPTWLDFYWDERVGYYNAPGRGGSEYRAFDYNRVKDLPDFDEFDPVSTEEMWERFLYLGRPIVEAAEQAGTVLSCHPNDPPVPIMRGMPRIMVTMNDVERFLKEIPGQANGITFCQGTFTEMGIDVIAAIRKLGNRIHHVHLRGVRGTVPHYMETFIDEGDVDMFEAMKTYKEIGYTGTIVSDHTPNVEGGSLVGRSFSQGYMRAMVQAVNAVM